MKTSKIFTLCLMGLAAVSLASCSDADDPITSLNFSRNLSPINVDAASTTENSTKVSWVASANATSYNLKVYEDSLSYKMEGTPAFEASNIEIKDLPYTISGLFYDTKYTVYVQAVTNGNEGRTSTWNGAYFRTSAKQFLKNPKPADIADRSVTLTWEAEDGFTVTSVKVGDITRDLTAEEISASKATITGLQPETEYTAYLYYNGKQCGNRKFSTIADLNGATLVHPEDDLTAIIQEAEEGATIAIYGGTYYLNATTDEESGEVLTTGAVKVQKSLIIKGIYPTDRPTIKGRFEIYGGAGLSISQAIIDGTLNSTTDQTFNYKEADLSYGALTVENCEIFGIENCKGLLYGNVTATIESITFNNCLIHDFTCEGGDFFDIRKSYAKKVTFTNSTFYNIAQKRDFIRYDDASGSYTDAAPEILVDKCTINNVLNESSEKRLLYVRFVGNKITWTNNLVTNTKAVYTNQSKTSPITYQNNYYFGCASANLFAASMPDAEPATFWNGDTSGSNGEDPKYKDAANGDFTLGNESVAKKKVGDPRWY